MKITSRGLIRVKTAKHLNNQTNNPGMPITGVYGYCDDFCLREITYVSIPNSNTVTWDYFPLSVVVYSLYNLYC